MHHKWDQTPPADRTTDNRTQRKRAHRSTRELVNTRRKALPKMARRHQRTSRSTKPRDSPPADTQRPLRKQITPPTSPRARRRKAIKEEDRQARINNSPSLEAATTPHPSHHKAVQATKTAPISHKISRISKRTAATSTKRAPGTSERPSSETQPQMRSLHECLFRSMQQTSC